VLFEWPAARIDSIQALPIARREPGAAVPAATGVGFAFDAFGAGVFLGAGSTAAAASGSLVPNHHRRATPLTPGGTRRTNIVATTELGCLALPRHVRFP
jgi:hypothetical protein